MRASMVIVGTALVAVGLVAGWLLSSSRPVEPGGDYTVRGVEVVDPAGFIASADLDYLGDTGGPAFDVTAESRCYFSQPAASTDLNPIVRCGPTDVTGRLEIVFDPWSTYELRAKRNDDGYELELGRMLQRQAVLVGGEVLSRPDGVAPSYDFPFPPPSGTAPASEHGLGVSVRSVELGAAAEFGACMARRYGLLAMGVDYTIDDDGLARRVEFTLPSFDGAARHEVPYELVGSGRLEASWDEVGDSTVDAAVPLCAEAGLLEVQRRIDRAAGG